MNRAISVRTVALLAGVGGIAVGWAAGRHRLRTDMALLRAHTRDPVTGWPIRSVWEPAAAQRLRRRPHRTGLLLVDLDDFKTLNDQWGHTAGDHALRTVAQRLTTAFPTALGTRWGGDEFALVTDDDTLATGLDTFARCMTTPFVLHDQCAVTLRASVGIIRGGDLPHPNLTDAIAIADTNLYRAKHTAIPPNPPMRAAQDGSVGSSV